MSKKQNTHKILAYYPFDEKSKKENSLFEDRSGNGRTAEGMGTDKPEIVTIDGREGVYLKGSNRSEGTGSYIQLPADLLDGVSDKTGLTVTAWVRPTGHPHAWARIFDLGHGQTGPYIFLTRFMRFCCFAGRDLAADAGAPFNNEWKHIAVTVTPTMGGTMSSAGPRLYINGELAADGMISQTSSGNYKEYRRFLSLLERKDQFDCNYIGHSQYAVDPDFEGYISDFRVYGEALSQEEILSSLCETLSGEEIVKLAEKYYFRRPGKMITGPFTLQSGLLGGRVRVDWTVCPADVLKITEEPSEDGADERIRLTPAGGKMKMQDLRLTAKISCGESSTGLIFHATHVPEETAPYKLVVRGRDKVTDISRTLFGLFYEDINHAADGGIYAEMIRNRSFENFKFKVYDPSSGVDGISGGRQYDPLKYWFGDTDRITVLDEDGLNTHLGLTDPETNIHYIRMPKGARLISRGYCDEDLRCSMPFTEGGLYDFSLWARSVKGAELDAVLLDDREKPVSKAARISVPAGAGWAKYELPGLEALSTCDGQLMITSTGEVDLDQLSLMPRDVWGATAEKGCRSARSNYKGNPNYRLRRDMMQALYDMNPSFIRFPGGCISEGSYIWVNVYDWKDSVGPVEARKENYNVWEYGMTLGLGYMEYFQIAEDLHAEPLPVMACGVLCQARSDYANPAGGRLRQKYISNFTDLIDFALSTDFKNNAWARLRRDMGHREPFGLHYLGVGNENWGDEFFANFEIFYHEIMKHVKKYYPNHELTIVSTAGAQADDDAYQIGWQFLYGRHEGAEQLDFTDGEHSFPEEIRWYKHRKNYLDTIVDEHYYRSEDYLLENVDRYNYYERAYKRGHIDEALSPKVFVGEYACVEKNTLAGAIAEAATMVGCERNSDVVRMASTAPLFNRITSDGTYRWTPDCIWFDRRKVYRTPTYYVQQLFMSNLGERLLKTEEYIARGSRMKLSEPEGGISLSASGGRVLFHRVRVISNKSGELLLDLDLSAEKSGSDVRAYAARRGLGIAGDERKLSFENGGLMIDGGGEDIYLYHEGEDWKDYTVIAEAEKADAQAVIEIGAGLGNLPEDQQGCRYLSPGEMDLMKYCIGDPRMGTGLKVFKKGREGYALGDYSNSAYAGNKRACHREDVPVHVPVTATFNYGGSRKNVAKSHTRLIECSYDTPEKTGLGDLIYKLEAYGRDLFVSTTEDAEQIYVKIVNTEETEKLTEVSFKSMPVTTVAARILITGDEEQLHSPNINIAPEEAIRPLRSNILGRNGIFKVKIPARSVNVLIFKKKD